jgi:exodeoxyribonuclease V alpha subunit
MNGFPRTISDATPWDDPTSVLSGGVQENGIDSAHVELRPLDFAFGQLLRRLDSKGDSAIRAAGMLVSRQLAEGHSCLHLGRFAGRRLFFGGERSDGGVASPPMSVWLDRLRNSPLVVEPGGLAPLVLEHDRLYLHRYWQYESEVASRLDALMRRPVEIDDTRLGEGLRRLFPAGEQEGEVDWQQLAATLAVLKRLAVITGGPGTGKTYTVTRLLALLIEQRPDDPPRIALTAPTGKARARLVDSIAALLAKGLPCAESVTTRIREAARTARTLHGLLGMLPGRARCRHHAGHPLPHDILVVDEASMMDLPLMAHLLEALPDDGRLILLGDRNQLPPVEVGNLLSDLCAAAGEASYSPSLGERLQVLLGKVPTTPVAETGPLIRDSVAELRKPRRFTLGSGIAELADAVLRGDGDGCMIALDGADDLAWRDMGASEVEALLGEIVRDFILPCFHVRTVADSLARFDAFRVLCVARRGPFGVETINRTIERMLARQSGGRIGQEEWYQGKPVMITHNDPSSGLSNGDIGLAWPDPHSGNALRVFFPGERGALRALSPTRLPAHETVYCMTVHKSQGSEFGHVHLLLPDRPGPLLCRELIYTAVTRAKSRLSLYGSRAVLADAVSRRMARGSGLHIRLG